MPGWRTRGIGTGRHQYAAEPAVSARSESGALEASNVDLSTSLVNLIVAQQAYQANVQGINVDQQDVQKLLQLQ